MYKQLTATKGDSAVLWREDKGSGRAKTRAVNSDLEVRGKLHDLDVI